MLLILRPRRYLDLLYTQGIHYYQKTTLRCPAVKKTSEINSWAMTQEAWLDILDYLLDLYQGFSVCFPGADPMYTTRFSGSYCGKRFVQSQEIQVFLSLELVISNKMKYKHTRTFQVSEFFGLIQASKSMSIYFLF